MRGQTPAVIWRGNDSRKRPLCGAACERQGVPLQCGETPYAFHRARFSVRPYCQAPPDDPAHDSSHELQLQTRGRMFPIFRESVPQWNGEGLRRWGHPRRLPVSRVPTKRRRSRMERNCPRIEAQSTLGTSQLSFAREIRLFSTKCSSRAS